VLAKEYNSKGYSKSFATVQKLVTHSRCCPDAKALREGQREPTEPKQTKEEEEPPYRGDGDGEPNEILRHILSTFPGVNKAIVDAVNVLGRFWGYIPPHHFPYLLQHMKGASQGTHTRA
jgi:hypothetical protein